MLMKSESWLIIDNFTENMDKNQVMLILKSRNLTFIYISGSGWKVK